MAKSIEDLLVVMGELYTDTVAFRLKGDDYSTLEIISAPEGFVLPSEKELRDKLPEYVVDLLETPDVVKFIKKYPGARLFNAKSYDKKKC